MERFFTYYLLALTLSAGAAHGAPFKFSYSGRMTDEASGKPVDGPVDLEVNFFNAETGGTSIGSSPYKFATTALKEGVFQIAVELAESDIDRIFSDPSVPVYLEITATAPDGQTTTYPRQVFTPVPYALKVPIDTSVLSYASGKLTLKSGSTTNSSNIVTTINSNTSGTINASRLVGAGGDASGNLDSLTVKKLQNRPVLATAPSTGDVLKWDGSSWGPGTVSGGGGGTTSIAQGGTGATTAAGARSALGAAAAGANSDITSLTGLSTALSVAQGGTAATTASGARSALGAAAAGANSDITSLSGLSTALSVAQGGTGATSQAAAANAVLPSQSSNSGKYLTTDGSNASWGTMSSSQWTTSSSDIYYSSGKVGIGATSPGTKLEVAGAHDSTRGLIYVNGSDHGYVTLNSPSSGQAGVTFSSAGTQAKTLYRPENTTDLAVYDNAGSSPGAMVTFKTNGKVGIGTTSPSQKLSVAGTIESTTGGFKFPDGTTQTTAASGSSSSVSITENASAPSAVGSTAQLYAKPPSGSALDANTVFLTHAEDANFADASASSHTVTASGTVSLSSTAKFGSGSALFNGSSYLSISNSSDFDVGSGDFTIDFWVYPTSASRMALFAGGTDWWLGMDFHYNGTRNVNIWASSTGSSWDILHADGGGNGIGSVSIPLSQWTHIAMVRSGNQWMSFINGVRDLNVTSSGAVITKNESKRIGQWGCCYSMPFSGNIDEFRFSKGIARWTSNFTPPTQKYGPIPGTLHYLDSSGNTYQLADASSSTHWLGNTPGTYYAQNSSRFLNVSDQLRFAGNYTTSDARYKTNVESLSDPLAKVQNLRGVSFDFKQDVKDKKFPAGHQMGVIAQEVEKVFPDLVDTDQEGYKSVNYSALVAPLIEATKQLYAMFTSNEERVDAEILRLKEDNEALRVEHAAIKAYLCTTQPQAPFCAP